MFENTPAWDKRHNLPLVPKHNNPFLYLAISKKISNENYNCIDHWLNCLVDSQELGLAWRWPDHGGGNMSYDELLGASYCSKDIARWIWVYLKHNFGRYDNVNPQSKSFRHWMFRFPWAMAFIRSRASGTPGLWGIFYSLTLLFDAIKYKTGDEEGRLRIWLTLDEMSKHTISQWSVSFWRKKMHKKNLSPSNCLAISFADLPVYHQNAPTWF